MQNNIIRLAKLCVYFALSGSIALPAHAADQTTTDMDTVHKEWAEAVDSLQDFSVSQKDQAIEKTSDTLAQMDAQLEELEQQAKDDWNELSAEARESRMQALGELRKQRDALADWYQEIQGDSARAWDEMQKGIGSAYKELQKGWEEALEEF